MFIGDDFRLTRLNKAEEFYCKAADGVWKSGVIVTLFPSAFSRWHWVYGPVRNISEPF